MFSCVPQGPREEERVENESDELKQSLLDEQRWLGWFVGEASHFTIVIINEDIVAVG